MSKLSSSASLQYDGIVAPRTRASSVPVRLRPSWRELAGKPPVRSRVRPRVHHQVRPARLPPPDLVTHRSMSDAARRAILASHADLRDAAQALALGVLPDAGD
jgi:hypothetical protein